MSTKGENLRDPNSCLNKAGVHEPVFVLRASDPVAAQTIRLWADMSCSLRSAQKLADARAVAEAMDDWNAPKCVEG